VGDRCSGLVTMDFFCVWLNASSNVNLRMLVQPIAVGIARNNSKKRSSAEMCVV
jgi:hypothetical protein